MLSAPLPSQSRRRRARAYFRRQHRSRQELTHPDIWGDVGLEHRADFHLPTWPGTPVHAALFRVLCQMSLAIVAALNWNCKWLTESARQPEYALSALRGMPVPANETVAWNLMCMKETALIH